MAASFLPSETGRKKKKKSLAEYIFRPARRLFVGGKRTLVNLNFRGSAVVLRARSDDIRFRRVLIYYVFLHFECVPFGQYASDMTGRAS